MTFFFTSKWHSSLQVNGIPFYNYFHKMQFLTITFLLAYWKVRMKIEKKDLPDLANMMNNYFKAYDTGFDKLDHKSKEETIWFTCRVMPAMQKIWKPFVPQGTKSLPYYTAVSTSDKAYRLFLFQYYKPKIGNKKPDDTVEEDEEEKDKKEGDRDGKGDAELGVAAKKKTVRKERLSRKIAKVQDDYAVWYQRFQVLCK